MDRNSLRARWQNSDGQLHSFAVQQWLLGGPPPNGVGQVDGRWDLRGFELKPPTRSRRQGYEVATSDEVFHPRGVSWSGLDLRFSSLPSIRMTSVSVEDCLFDRAEMPDLRVWSTVFEGCSFAGAVLRGGALSTGNQGGICRWAEVNFDGADLRDAHFLGGEVSSCSFRRARLDEVSFLQTRLDGVLFSGAVRGVLFDERSIPQARPSPSVIRNADFSGARFENTEFIGCHFENAKWPDDVTIIPNYPRVAALAASYLEDDDSLDARLARAELTAWDSVPGATDSPKLAESSTGVLMPADLARFGTARAAELLEGAVSRARAHLAMQ